MQMQVQMRMRMRMRMRMQMAGVRAHRLGELMEAEVAEGGEGHLDRAPAAELVVLLRLLVLGRALALAREALVRAREGLEALLAAAAIGVVLQRQ